MLTWPSPPRKLAQRWCASASAPPSNAWRRVAAISPPAPTWRRSGRWERSCAASARATPSSARRRDRLDRRTADASGSSSTLRHPQLRLWRAYGRGERGPRGRRPARRGCRRRPVRRRDLLDRRRRGGGRAATMRHWRPTQAQKSAARRKRSQVRVSGETSRNTSLTMTELEAPRSGWPATERRPPSQRLLVRATALHDQVQVVLVLEDAEILEGIALHDEEVRVLSWFHGADPILHAEDLRVDAGGGEQHLHGLHDLGLQLELDGALGLHVAEEIGARADLAAGPVGLGQPLHGELACRVDLLELMLAHPVGLALAPDG